MKKVILVYQTDCWHTKTSRSLIGVATTETVRDNLISVFLKTESASQDEIEAALSEIRKDGQTQMLSEKHDFEILTENVPTNQVLI